MFVCTLLLLLLLLYFCGEGQFEVEHWNSFVYQDGNYITPSHSRSLPLTSHTTQTLVSSGQGKNWEVHHLRTFSKLKNLLTFMQTRLSCLHSLMQTWLGISHLILTYFIVCTRGRNSGLTLQKKWNWTNCWTEQQQGQPNTLRHMQIRYFAEPQHIF